MLVAVSTRLLKEILQFLLILKPIFQVYLVNQWSVSHFVLVLSLCVHVRKTPGGISKPHGPILSNFPALMQLCQWGKCCILWWWDGQSWRLPRDKTSSQGRIGS